MRKGAVVKTTGPGGAGAQPAAANGRDGAVHGHSLRNLAREELIEDFRLSCLSRALDDREILLQKQSRVFFQISGAGHEIILTALARSMRPASDWFFPYYRDRALVLALGVTPKAVMLEAVGSSEDPASGGRQMPCHWGDVDLNIVTQSSPTGSQCLPAVGCAEASRYIAPRPGLVGCSAVGDEITYVSLGEGTTSEGEFWESLNSACKLHLPVLYLIADNGFAISVRSSDQTPAPINELVRGFRGLAVTQVEGWDYASCRHKGARAVARVRAGEGPGLIHAHVTRPYSHSSADAQTKYRGSDELADEAVHDPIDVFEHDLIDAGIIDADEAAGIRAAAREEAAVAAEEALAAARPDPATVTRNVFRSPLAISTTSDSLKSDDSVGRTAQQRTPTAGKPAPWQAAAKKAGVTEAGTDESIPLTMADAIRTALHELLEADERIRVFGEDVADADDEVLEEVEGKGGVFGVTRGLQRRFGSARCFNTPLAESNIVGRGIGQAIRGLRPCAEIQFFDYIWPAMQQLRSEAATTQVALERDLPLPARRAGSDRRLPDRRSDLALPVRRVDLLSHPRAARRLPLACRRCSRAAQDRVRLRRPGALLGAQAPLQAALRGGPHAAQRREGAVRIRIGRKARTRSDDRHMGGHGPKVARCRRSTRG